ncbi:MAG: aryl-sulfate sulfotransferase, partial [Chloroflexi bacterium]|nr:aryl-sulfate sulfotransferase [Chloroflexota bacterium]
MKRGCIALLVMVLILSACAQRVPTEEETPPSVPTSAPEVITAPAQPATPAPELTPTPSDTTAPSAITGLMAVNAYDGKVNLWWDKSGAEDFDHYNIYVSESEMGDVAGTSPIYQIKNISTTNYQATGLEDGTEYYFAVMAVDKNGNEERRVTSLSATPTPMPRGTEDSDFQVDAYQSDMVWAGTTLLPDNHNLERPRIMEINMLGEVVWEYILPENLKQYTNPGFDVELLSNNNILFVLPRKGVYEIDRNGKVVWSYLTDKISHDADRLPNGNTIFAFGAYDKKDDAQVIEVNQEGEVTWSWYARGYFDKPPYKDIDDEGWTHTNAVTRLPNGNTLISPRNFDFVVEVNPGGSVVRTIGEGILDSQHDPEVLVNGNILLMNQTR